MPRTSRRHRVLAIAVVVGIATAACTSVPAANPPAEGSALGAASPDSDASVAHAMDPCSGDDHPCLQGDATDDVRAASDALALEAEAHLGPDGDDVETAAAWLRDQPGVVHAAVGDGVVRFRMEGGRGTWVFARTAADPTLTTLSAPTAPVPTRRVVAAPAPPSPLPAALGEDQGKDALLLSPMAWQWQLEDVDDGVRQLAETIASVRDYQPANGGSVTVVEDALGRDDEGTFIDARIGVEEFRSWSRYDAVYLLTHGGFACEGEATPTDAAGASSCTTGVLTSWTWQEVTRAREGAAAGDTAAALELRKLLDAVGIETAWIAVDQPTTSLPTGRGLRAEAAGGPAGINDGGDGRNDAPTTSGDQTAGDNRTVMGPFLLLTADFFRHAYPQQLTDTLVFVNACWSGLRPDLLQALSGPGTAVLGWDKAMYLDAAVAAAQAVHTALLTTDDAGGEPLGGLRLQAAMDAVADEVRAHLRASSAGSRPQPYLSIVDDAIGDGGSRATLGTAGDDQRRIREVAHLVDDQGTDLAASSVRVEGQPGDGVDDELVLGVRVDGIDPDQDASDARLAVVVDGTRHELEQRLDRRVRAGVWETTATVPLGRDHQPEETVDLEVDALLPEGRESRWLYRDVPLGAGCWFHVTYAGTATRGGTTDTFNAVADWSSSEGAEGGGVQVVNVEPGGMTEDVRQLRWFDLDPLVTSVQVGDVEVGTGIDLGATGTFEVIIGTAFRTSPDPDRVFEAAGRGEVTITTNTVVEGSDGTPLLAVLAGTFHNVEMLQFDNPFPENGTRADVAELVGSFRVDREVCGGFTW